MAGTEMPGDMSLVSKVDIDELVGKIKPKYKKLDSFKECIGMDMGIKSCLFGEVNKKVMASGDIKYCSDLLSERDVNMCILGFIDQKVSQTGDVKYCEVIADTGLKQNCMDRALIVKAIMSDDISACDMVSEGMQGQCEERVIVGNAVKNLQASKCDALGEMSKEMCIMEVQFAKDEQAFMKEHEEQMEQMNQVETFR